MRWTVCVAVAALVLAGCASEPPEPTGLCRQKYAVVSDREAGVENPVRVEVRVQNGLTDAPLADHFIYADMRPHRSGQYDRIESAQPCMAAATNTDRDGAAVLFLTEGRTYSIVHPAVPVANPWAPGVRHLWTVEVLPNTTIESRMAPLVLPVYPGYANFTWNGTIRGVDPNGNSPVEVNFPLFSEDDAQEAELLRRLPRTSGGAGRIDEVSLRWTNALTTWGDLMVNIRHGDYFINVEPQDKTQSPGDGPQEERLCTDGPKECGLYGAKKPGDFVVAVYNTGGLVAPDGLPFSATVHTWFTGPYED